MSVQHQVATLNVPSTDAQTVSTSPDPLQVITMDIKGEDGRAKKEQFAWGPLLGKVRFIKAYKGLDNFLDPHCTGFFE